MHTDYIAHLKHRTIYATCQKVHRRCIGGSSPPTHHAPILAYCSFPRAFALDGTSVAPKMTLCHAKIVAANGVASSSPLKAATPGCGSTCTPARPKPPPVLHPTANIMPCLVNARVYTWWIRGRVGLRRSRERAAAGRTRSRRAWRRRGPPPRSRRVRGRCPRA